MIHFSLAIIHSIHSLRFAFATPPLNLFIPTDTFIDAKSTSAVWLHFSAVLQLHLTVMANCGSFWHWFALAFPMSVFS